MSDARRGDVRSGVKRGGVRARPASAGPTASAAESIAKISPARVAAFEILKLVGEGKGHSDELLHSERIDALSLEDRNLTMALVMGVLRWQIALDARIGKLLARPDQRLAEPVALALRIGAFQLLHMDRIPAHAALNESVELCRAAGQPHAAGMVNAILRKLAAAQKPGQRIFESTAAFAERLGHPLWLVERWVAAYGREAALAICEYGQREPVSGGLFVAHDTAEPPTTAPIEPLSRDAAPQMDDGSRLVAELAAVALPVVAGRAARVWDCCAAPGGKTLMLALRLNPTLEVESGNAFGAEILATDASARRMALMALRLRRFAYVERIQCAVADASSTDAVLKTRPELPVAESFDLILCDVPCSGTGTLARNPEIRHRLRVEELARQAERQSAILRGALRRLAPGGRLVYSTCSLEPEENERVVEAVANEVGLRRIPIEPLIARLAEAGVLKQEIAAGLIQSAVRDGALRTLSGVHGCDGFFAVVLERQ
ncbi:MAG: transcription antitermination factor NusB [Acidobacteriaceae bacterium]|nr:transcription antitermination factor NusB [Acidobacteriaceae bacterium]